MANHTPGPWHIESEFVGLHDVFTVYSDQKPYAKVIAKTALYTKGREVNHNPADQEIEANAALIAASPDLLVAAKYALAVLLKVDEIQYADAVKRAEHPVVDTGPCDALANAIDKVELNTLGRDNG